MDSRTKSKTRQERRLDRGASGGAVVVANRGGRGPEQGPFKLAYDDPRRRYLDLVAELIADRIIRGEEPDDANDGEDPRRAARHARSHRTT